MLGSVVFIKEEFCLAKSLMQKKTEFFFAPLPNKRPLSKLILASKDLLLKEKMKEQEMGGKKVNSVSRISRKTISRGFCDITASATNVAKMLWLAWQKFLKRFFL